MRDKARGRMGSPGVEEEDVVVVVLRGGELAFEVPLELEFVVLGVPFYNQSLTSTFIWILNRFKIYNSTINNKNSSYKITSS